MNKLIKFLTSIWNDQLGEGDPAGGDGQGGAPADGGQSGTPAGKQGDQGSGDGQGDDGGAGTGAGDSGQPIYGEFGDDPNKVWQAFQETKKKYEGITAKTTQTERNLSALRSQLEASGLKIVTDAQGNPQIIAETQKEKQRRFNDESKKKLSAFFEGGKPEFVDEFLGGLAPYFQDLIDDVLEQRDQTVTKKTTEQKKFNQARTSSNDLMVHYFPQLKESAENFNQPFWQRATDIYQSKYISHPEGELLASLEAARELNILPNMMVQAKKEGVQVGKNGKEILGPVNGGQGKKGAGGFKNLSKDEYLKLSPEDKEKYNKEKMQLK